MKKIMAIAGLMLTSLAWGQTFPVNNLTVAGTSNFSGLAQFVVSPTGPTPTPGDSSGKFATTAFVAGLAPLSGPVFTGTPLAPTAALGTNTAQIATTAFVVNHQGCKNILDFGGNNAGLNPSSNNNAWTAAIAAQAGSNSVCVYFPPGKFLFNSTLSYTMSTLGASVSVVGDGSSQSVLVFPTGVNGLTLTTKDWTSSIHVRSLTLQTQGVGTANGLTLLQGSGSVSNPANSAASDVYDVTFMGSDGYTSGGPTSGTNYWSSGTVVNAVSNINYISDFWLGAFGGGTGLGTGISLVGSSSTQASVVHNFVGCNFIFNNASIVMGTWVQGVSLTATNLTEVNTGVVANGSAGMVQLAIANSQFSTYSTGVSVTGPLVNVSITNNLFYVGSSAAAINVNNASATDYNITNNQFFPGFSPVAPIGIAVQNSTAGSSNLISGNVFNSLSTGILMAAGAGAWGIGNNSFAGVTTKYSMATSSYLLLGSMNAGGNSCGAALAANTNDWIGTCLSSLTQNTTLQIASQPVTAARLSVQTTSPVGAGQSYVATVYLNGAATALTCTVSGASLTACNDFTHFVPISQNGNYTLLVTTSAGATPVGVFWSMLLQP